MPRIKRREVSEIRLIDRQLEAGRFESTCYIKARGRWYKDTRYPAPEYRSGTYNRDDIIKEFIAFQNLYERCDEPGGFAD